MFNAQVVPIMIASPSDVQAERDLVRQIIFGINYTDAFSKSLVLLPVGWETHSSPELGRPAQDQINERLVDRCDILIGIFWTKLGTPTENEESGSVEEIKRHVDAGKPALIYFCDRPVAPDSLEADQWKARQQFKSWCQKNGIYHSYTDNSQLERDFNNHLRITLTENEYVRGLTASYRQTAEAEEGNGLTSRKLGIEAIMLLFSAADGDGEILALDHMAGRMYQAGKFEISTASSGRRSAKWRHALNELDRLGLVEEPSLGSGRYIVTDSGFDAVDRNESAREQLSQVNWEAEKSEL